MGSKESKERRRAYAHEYYWANRERILAGLKRRRADDPELRARVNAKGNQHWQENKEAYRAHHLKRKYNMSLGDYENLLKAQQGVCAICQQPERRRAKHGGTALLAVDHDHATGKVRGLLCFTCNRAIGLFQDSPELLTEAAIYLRTHQD